ncbi:MAG: L-cystine transporter [Pseudomonadales bacterium]
MGFGLNLLVFITIAVALQRMGARGMALSYRVLAGLVLGALFGLGLQLVFGIGAEPVSQTMAWVNVVGSGYVSLLKMIVMPLVLTSIVGAVIKMGEIATLGKIGGLVISILVGTTAIAALVGIGVSVLFGLSADGLTEGARELARAETLIARQESVAGLSVTQILVSFIPQNIFEDLAGLRPTSIIAVVIFGMFLGVAGLLVERDDPELGARFHSFVDVAQRIVLQLVRMVISLTPYGVLALMSKVSATSDGGDILSLVNFLLASYVAILVMFVVHAVIVMLVGFNPLDYLKRVWPVLVFAFTSRSSAATIPLNVETQTGRLGNHSSVANLSASFGATIGQNGCAGIYPAMLAVMIAPSMGVNPLDPGFVATLVGIVAISSFGVAGVGGGATFAALIVLPALGFPVALAALLISIEPLIDMARTALNVNGAMVAGTATDRLLGLTKEQPNSTS